MVQIQGIQRRGDGKDCAPPSSVGVGVRWACLAIFFLAFGLGELCTGTPGTCLREGSGGGVSGWSVQPKGAGALALAHFN